MRYSYFSQKDFYWADKKIPGTNLTMKLWGCAITCLNMLAVYYGKETTPGELMYKLKYAQGGAVIWNSLTEIYPDIKFIERVNCKNTAAPISKIDSYLSSGYPVIAEVDANYGQTGVQQHFVVLYAKQGDDYLMCDPYFEIEMGSFKAKYGNPSRYIYGLVLYKGIVPEPPQTSPEPLQCTKELEVIDNLQKEVSSLKDQIKADARVKALIYGEFDSDPANQLIRFNRKVEMPQNIDGLTNPHFTSPTYVSANSFSVVGDVTSWLRPRRGLVITFQTSGVKRGAVRNVFYDSGTNKSTINVIGDSLVNEPITSVLISSSDMEGAFSKFDPNLVLYLPLEENTGTMTKDLSGWGNHGTLVNGPTWTTGRVGKCLSFDSDDYVRCAIFNGVPSSYLTVCAWIKTSSTSEQTILTQGRSPSNYSNVYDFKVKNNKLQFWDYTGTAHGFNESQYSNTTVTDGNWHFVCFVKNGTSGTYYLDGNADGTPTAAINVSYVNNDFVIGRDYRDNILPFNGLIDEVRIYNRALSASEIQDHYLNP